MEAKQPTKKSQEQDGGSPAPPIAIAPSDDVPRGRKQNIQGKNEEERANESNTRRNTLEHQLNSNKGSHIESPQLPKKTGREAKGRWESKTGGTTVRNARQESQGQSRKTLLQHMEAEAHNTRLPPNEE